MLIGEQQYPIQQSILFLILIIVLVSDVVLFNRGHGSYTVKYQLMRKHKFYRVHQLATLIVDCLYKLFFALPFVIILAITVLEGMKQIIGFPPILVNGLIVVLIIYPIHREFYYFQYGVIWFLALASQLLTEFLSTTNQQSSSFIEISFIFYTANSMVFCLALLYNQKVYWQLQQAVKMCDPLIVSKVNETWVDPSAQRKLPQIFYGGIYGSMSRNYSFTVFITLYIFSLSILGVYAIVIYILQQTSLGITGLITSFIYDIFILIFSTLPSQQRSIKNIFYMVYIGRLLSFIFGQQYWLFGYCVMYFLVGVFVGSVVIDKVFPLKIEVVKKESSGKRERVNALKTPEFVLLVLTVEIIVLIIVEQFTTISDVSDVSFNGQKIPVWQFAILIVLATWVIILYLICGRLLSRHIKRIHAMVEYYFGFANFTQYHLYMLLTYLFIIVAGLYSLLYLHERSIFLGTIFLPLVYLLVFQIGAAWVKNDYAILADTEEYNKREIRKLEIKQSKQRMIANRLKQQRGNKLSKLKIKQKQEQEQDTKTNMQQTGKQLIPNKKRIIPTQTKTNPYQTTTQQKQQYQQTSSQNTQHQPSSDINIYLQNDSLSQKQSQQQNLQNYKPALNWRVNTSLTYTEIWQNLTKHDKTILVFSVMTLVVFVVYTLVSYLWAESVWGLAFSLSIVSLMTTFVFYKVNMSGEQYNVGEVLCGVAGFLLGVVFWAVEYEVTYGGIIWAVCAIILYGLSLQTGLQKHMQLLLVIILSTKIILLLCFICILLGLQYGLGVGIVSGAIVICCLLGVINMYFLQSKSYLPKSVKYLTGLVIVGIVVALAVIGFAQNLLSDFSVFTILMAVIIIAFYIVHLLIYFSKQLNQSIHPHIYSAYGLTIYRFQSQNQKLKPSTNHVVIFNVSMVLLVVYSAITTLFFQEKQFAIYALSIFMIFQFTELVFRSIQTYYYCGKYKGDISEKIVREAFRTVMEKYMPDQTEGEDSPFYIKKFSEKKLKAQEADTPQQRDKLWKQTVQLKEQVLKNLQQEQKFLFFWLALIRFTLYTQKQNKMNDFLILMQQIKPQLDQYGIAIQGIDSADPVQIKYKLVQKEIKALTALDVVLVEEMITSQMQVKRKKLKEEEKLHVMNQKAHQQKLQQLFKQQSAQITVPLKQSIVKAKNKIQEFTQTLNSIKQNQLYTDNQFPHDFTVIGDKLQSVVAVWRRPKPVQKFITGSGMSPDDVKQGMIGDCYLISSFAVLGEKFLKMAIGQSDLVQPSSKKIWKNQKGAYMIKFHKFSRQVYITVDDYLPVDTSNNWIFATSEDSLQFWPGILEKAYAKLYGGYQNIVSGKCHQVLAEFTGGFPFEVIVKDYKSNTNALWNRMLNAQKNGYLLAAGSPANERGDTVSSQRGIVQGHAYSILDVRLAQKYKLIKLKNPHGSAGKEWNGPFSDESRYMTQKIREELKHEKKNDGIFWMQLQDFIAEFKSLYICCIFQKDWKKHQPISAMWKKNINSFGRPQKTSQSHKNYQMGITVNKKCTVFISLSQRQVSALNGQNFIYLRVQRNQGRRLRKNDINSQDLCGQATKPSNSATISQQIQLESNQYPYTFTVYMSAERQVDGGVQPGHGEFQLQVFCNDMESILVKNQEFDQAGMKDVDE